MDERAYRLANFDLTEAGFKAFAKSRAGDKGEELAAMYRRDDPVATPFVLQGHKVAAGLAVVSAVVAEFVAGSGKVQGLAWRIMDASFKLQTARMFAALVVLGALGAALYALMDLAERGALRWWRGR